MFGKNEKSRKKMPRRGEMFVEPMQNELIKLRRSGI